MNPKNRCKPGLQSEIAVFCHLQAFDYFEVSPLRRDLSKKPLSGLQSQTAIFSPLEISKDFKDTSEKYEAKNCCWLVIKNNSSFLALKDI
jgi:hypothetical protein